MLTDEEIQTIRLAKSAGPGHYEAAGNLEFAFHGAICEPFFLELNPAGLTIAAQAEEIERLKADLEQACEVAEEMWDDVPLENTRNCVFKELQTMRKNRSELLGDG